MAEFKQFLTEVWGDIKLGSDIEGLGRLFVITWNNLEIPLAVDGQGKLWFLATVIEGTFDQLAQGSLRGLGSDNVYWHPLMAGGGEQIRDRELKDFTQGSQSVEVQDALDFAYRWLKQEIRLKKARLRNPRKFDKEVDILNRYIGKPNWLTKTQIQTRRLYEPPEKQIERRQRRQRGWS